MALVTSEELETKAVALFPRATTALYCLMRAILNQGDEVVVPACCCDAVPFAVNAAGGTLRFVDVEPGTYLASPQAIAAAIGPRTRAVMAVDLFGHRSALKEIRSAIPRNVLLVQDASMGSGLTSFGLAEADAVLVSLGRGKMMSVPGGGGILVAGREMLASVEFACRRRNAWNFCSYPSAAIIEEYQLSVKGRDSAAAVDWRAIMPYYLVDRLPARLSMATPVLSSPGVARRSVIAAQGYRRLLGNTVVHPIPPQGSVYARYSILLADSQRRDALVHRLQCKGVPVSTGFGSIAPAYGCAQRFAVAERIGELIINLPTHELPSFDDIEMVANIVRTYTS